MMEIKYLKTTNEIPEGIRQVTEALFLEDTESPEGYTILKMYVKAKRVYAFEVIPDAEYGMITDIINEVIANVVTGNVDVTGDDKQDLLTTLNTNATAIEAARKKSSNFIKLTEDAGEDFDYENKLFYHLATGDVYYSDATKFDWDRNIENIDALHKALDTTKSLIKILLTETIVKKVDKNDNVVEEIPVEKFVESELNRFYKINNFEPDYSVYEGKASDRELLLIRITDIIILYQEMIQVTNVIAAQKHIFEEMNKKDETEDGASEDVAADDAQTVTPEIVDPEIGHA